MYELDVIVLASVLSGLLGLAIGAALHKSTSKAEEQTRKLNKALAEAEASKADYQQQVARHFTATAHMLNDLTEKYRDVHHHLAAGADSLCRDDQGHSLLGDSSIDSAAGEKPIAGLSATGLSSGLPGTSRENSASAEAPATTEAPQPPLDYAPKSESNSGTLSEDYGLEKVNLHAEQHTSAANAENDDLLTPEHGQPAKHSV